MDAQLKSDAVSLLERLREEAEREMGGTHKVRRVRVCEMLLERVAGAPPGPGFTMADVQILHSAWSELAGDATAPGPAGCALKNLADRIEQWVRAGAVL